MSGINIKSSVKVMAIACLAIGVSSMGLAQSDSGSVVNALNNAAGSSNIAPSPMHSGRSGGSSSHSSGGSSSHSSGGWSGRSSGGSTSGSTGGNGNPPGCVPEPISMLALGVGSGIVMLKKRAKKA